MKLLYPFIALRNRTSAAWAAVNAHRYDQSWEPEIPDIRAVLGAWSVGKLNWKSDPLGGFLDHIQSIPQMNDQLRKEGRIMGDCDDLATYWAYLLSRLPKEEGIKSIYRVNIFPRYRHVLCVYLKDGYWYYTSNSNMIYEVHLQSIRDCVAHWCWRHNHKPTRWYYTERMG